MNARARNRLIGVTVIVLAIIAAIFYGMSGGQGAYYKTVAEVEKDSSLIGKNVQVGGPVVNDSWDKKTHPMTFQITDTTGKPKLKVVYNGNIPNTFGNGVQAIVTGKLQQGGVIEAANDGLVIKCPEKKASATSALAVDKLIAAKAQLKGVPVKVTGILAADSLKPAGTEPRFEIKSQDGKSVLAVAFDGGIPDNVKEGAVVVLGGNIDANSGLFDASSVALAK